jgi:hypothetical protein
MSHNYFSPEIYDILIVRVPAITQNTRIKMELKYHFFFKTTIVLSCQTSN